MANPDYYLCDLCGKQTKYRLPITIDRRLNAAGSSEDVCELKDLCPEHLMAAVQMLLKDVDDHRIDDHDQGIRLLKWIEDNARSKK